MICNIISILNQQKRKTHKLSARYLNFGNNMEISWAADNERALQTPCRLIGDNLSIKYKMRQRVRPSVSFCLRYPILS